jgi:hypothetical protein
MGVMEYRENNLDCAKNWLEKGKRCPQKNPESLLWLELNLSDHLAEYDGQKIIMKILSCRDLSMNFTRGALAAQAEFFLRKRKWDDADAILERVLSVEDVPGIRWMKWTIAKARGDEMEAEKQLRLAKTKSYKAVPNIYQAIGWYYLGDIGKTREYLAKAQQDGLTKERITQINPELGAILEMDNLGQKAEEAN